MRSMTPSRIWSRRAKSRHHSWQRTKSLNPISDRGSSGLSSRSSDSNLADLRTGSAACTVRSRTWPKPRVWHTRISCCRRNETSDRRNGLISIHYLMGEKSSIHMELLDDVRADGTGCEQKFNGYLSG